MYEQTIHYTDGTESVRCRYGAATAGPVLPGCGRAGTAGRTASAGYCSLGSHRGFCGSGNFDPSGRKHAGISPISAGLRTGLPCFGRWRGDGICEWELFRHRRSDPYRGCLRHCRPGGGLPVPLPEKSRSGLAICCHQPVFRNDPGGSLPQLEQRSPAGGLCLLSGRTGLRHAGSLSMRCRETGT